MNPQKLGFYIIALIFCLALARAHCVPDKPLYNYPPNNYGSWSITNLPPAGSQIYDPNGPWNTPVPPNPTVDPNSPTMINYLYSLPCCRTGKLGDWGWNHFGFSGNTVSFYDGMRPIYFSKPSDPLFTIHCVQFSCGGLEGKQVRIPAVARPAGGNDHHLAVIDQTTGTEYDFYGFGCDAGGNWLPLQDQGNGDRIAPTAAQSVITGNTIYCRGAGQAPVSGSGFGAGATASSANLWGGQVRAVEWEWAAAHNTSLPHALAIQMACSNPDGIIYPPALGADSKCAPGTPAPHYGQRLWLDMSDAEIEALPGKPWQKVIYRTLAKYGAYYIDSNGDWGIIWFTESKQMYQSYGMTDPYVTLGAKWGIYPDPPGPTGAIWLGWEIDGYEARSRLRWLDKCISFGTCCPVGTKPAATTLPPPVPTTPKPTTATPTTPAPTTTTPAPTTTTPAPTTTTPMPTTTTPAPTTTTPAPTTTTPAPTMTTTPAPTTTTPAPTITTLASTTVQTTPAPTITTPAPTTPKPSTAAPTTPVPTTVPPKPSTPAATTPIPSTPVPSTPMLSTVLPTSVPPVSSTPAATSPTTTQDVIITFPPPEVPSVAPTASQPGVTIPESPSASPTLSTAPTDSSSSTPDSSAPESSDTISASPSGTAVTTASPTEVPTGPHVICTTKWCLDVVSFFDFLTSKTFVPRTRFRLHAYIGCMKRATPGGEMDFSIDYDTDGSAASAVVAYLSSNSVPGVSKAVLVGAILPPPIDTSTAVPTTPNTNPASSSPSSTSTTGSQSEKKKGFFTWKTILIIAAVGVGLLLLIAGIVVIVVVLVKKNKESKPTSYASDYAQLDDSIMLQRLYETQVPVANPTFERN